jgi:PKD repeat protein
MKTLYHTFALVCLLCLQVGVGSAQTCSGNLIQNPSFSNGTNNWATFSGFIPNPVPQGNGCLDTFMVLRAYNMPPKAGDGMEQNVSLDSGKCYNLCMCMGDYFGAISYNDVQFWALKNNPNITFDSLLTNNYPPGDAQLIDIIPVNFPNPTQTYCINGWYATDSFTRLVIFNSTDSAVAQVLIDNICLTGSSVCSACQAINLTAGFTYSGNGTTVQFTNTTTLSGGNIIKYEWNFGDGANAPNDTSTATNPTYVFSSIGTYFVCLKAYAQGANGPICVDSFCLDVVLSPAVPLCDTTGNGFTFTTVGNTVSFNGQTGGTPIGWSWNFGDPSSGTNDTSSLQNPSHVFTGSGAYNVCLTIIYAGTTGVVCQDTICQTVTIGGSVGVSEIALSRVSVFPNPTNGDLNITNVTQPDVLQLYDYQGREVWRTVVNPGANQWQLNTLTEGIYFYSLQTAQQSGKLMVVK